MIALSIKLPESLADASRRVASKLGISRSELIRRSLEHEIASVEAALERRAMAEGFKAMGESKAALREAEELDQGLSEPLAKERDNWWKA